jgi:hypothetical protein
MKTDTSQLYEHIGSLFYAVAVGQGITAIEVPELKVIVRSFWQPRNYDATWALVSHEGHHIILALDELFQDNVSAADAFRDFEKFFIVYPEVFSNELKWMMFETCREIIDVFPARNVESRFDLNILHELIYPSEILFN